MLKLKVQFLPCCFQLSDRGFFSKRICSATIQEARTNPKERPPMTRRSWNQLELDMISLNHQYRIEFDCLKIMNSVKVNWGNLPHTTLGPFISSIKLWKEFPPPRTTPTTLKLFRHNGPRSQISSHCILIAILKRKNYPGPDHRDWKEEAGEKPVETVLWAHLWVQF